jgi:hypothetical protein
LNGQRHAGTSPGIRLFFWIAEKDGRSRLKAGMTR